MSARSRRQGDQARFVGLAPASDKSSRSAQGSSRKRDTKPELALRRALFAMGIRGYRIAPTDLPGKPDLVFRRPQVVVFCDGDFWHGRDLRSRLAKLEQGHNAAYWVTKIRGNVERDARHDATLRAQGWFVLRLWESDILSDPKKIATLVARVLDERAA